jgi:hypothetical protein
MITYPATYPHISCLKLSQYGTQYVSVSVQASKYGGQLDLPLLDSWGRTNTLFYRDLESMSENQRGGLDRFMPPGG